MRVLLHLVVLCAAAVGPGASTAQQTAYWVPVRGAVDVGLSEVVGRALEAGERSPGAVVVLELDAAGGRLDIAQLIADDITVAAVPVYALVNARAWGAAALLALAADSLYVVPGASLGGGNGEAEETRDLPAAALAAIRGSFAPFCERRGVDPRLCEAMVDRGMIVEGVVDGRRTLTLEAGDAVGVGIAVDTVAGPDGLLERLAIEAEQVVDVGSGWTATTVEVTNYHLQDARVLLMRGGVRYSLGNVTSMGSAEFEIPATLLPAGARVRVLAELIGSSERVDTEEIRVQPGLVIQWVIEQVLSQSNVVYFVRR